MLGHVLAERFLKDIAGQINGGVTSCYMGLLTHEPDMTISADNVVTAESTAGYEPAIGTANYARELLGSYSSGANNIFDSTIRYNSTGKYYYTTNTRQIKFNKASATWTANGSTSITHFALFGSATNGTLIAYGVLTSPITVQANMSANVEVGQAELRLYAEVSA